MQFQKKTGGMGLRLADKKELFSILSREVNAIPTSTSKLSAYSLRIMFVDRRDM